MQSKVELKLKQLESDRIFRTAGVEMAAFYKIESIRTFFSFFSWQDSLLQHLPKHQYKILADDFSQMCAQVFQSQPAICFHTDDLAELYESLKVLIKKEMLDQREMGELFKLPICVIESTSVRTKSVQGEYCEYSKMSLAQWLAYDFSNRYSFFEAPEFMPLIGWALEHSSLTQDIEYKNDASELRVPCFTWLTAVKKEKAPALEIRVAPDRITLSKHMAYYLNMFSFEEIVYVINDKKLCQDTFAKELKALPFQMYGINFESAKIWLEKYDLGKRVTTFNAQDGVSSNPNSSFKI